MLRHCSDGSVSVRIPPWLPVSADQSGYVGLGLDQVTVSDESPAAGDCLRALPAALERESELPLPAVQLCQISFLLSKAKSARVNCCQHSAGTQ